MVEQSVTASRYVDCVVPCKSVEVEEKARALLGPLAVRTYRTGTKALSYQSCADERTRAKALSGQSRADERTSAKALSGPKPCG